MLSGGRDAVPCQHHWPDQGWERGKQPPPFLHWCVAPCRLNQPVKREGPSVVGFFSSFCPWVFGARGVAGYGVVTARSPSRVSHSQTHVKKRDAFFSLFSPIFPPFLIFFFNFFLLFPICSHFFLISPHLFLISPHFFHFFVYCSIFFFGKTKPGRYFLKGFTNQSHCFHVSGCHQHWQGL